MGKRKGSVTGGQNLRRRAETRLKNLGREAAGSTASAAHLGAELEVHKVELQIQNEELRAARLALEATLARYTELFEFAPLGYAVLGVDETILEINLAGAALLGRDRS